MAMLSVIFAVLLLSAITETALTKPELEEIIADVTLIYGIDGFEDILTDYIEEWHPLMVERVRYYVLPSIKENLLPDMNEI